jgi:MFS family permease
MSIDAKLAPGFTVGDWIGTVIAGFAATGLLLFPVVGRSFASMFRDFGDANELPALTRLAISGWFPAALGITAVVGLGAGTRRSARLSRRRAFIVAAFIVGCVGIGLCLVGVYLPIFSIAGKVTAD